MAIGALVRGCTKGSPPHDQDGTVRCDVETSEMEPLPVIEGRRRCQLPMGKRKGLAAATSANPSSFMVAGECFGRGASGPSAGAIEFSFCAEA